MNGLHDVRLPAGPQAAALAELWTIMLWVCVLVFVLAMAALAISIRRAASNRHEGKAPAAIDASRVSTLQRWIGGGVAASSLLLFGLLFASFRADRLTREPAARYGVPTACASCPRSERSRS